MVKFLKNLWLLNPRDRPILVLGMISFIGLVLMFIGFSVSFILGFFG